MKRRTFLLLKPRRLSRLKRVNTLHGIKNCRRVTSHHFSFHSAGGQFDDMKSICAQMVLLPPLSNLVLLGCSECSRSRREDVCLPGNLLNHHQHSRDAIKGTLQRLATGFDSFHRIASRDEEARTAVFLLSVSAGPSSLGSCNVKISSDGEHSVTWPQRRRFLHWTENVKLASLLKRLRTTNS